MTTSSPPPIPARAHPARRGRAVVVALTAVLGVAMLAGVVPAAGKPGGPPTVSPEAPATASSQTAMRSNNSPAMVADPTDGRFVAMAHRLDGPDFSCALQLSGDRGRSWVPADPVPRLPPGAEKCYAPEIDFDAKGVLYYLFVGLAGRGNRPMGTFLTTSDDRGRTFSRPRNLLGPLNFTVRMAIDRGLGRRGRIHMIWTHAGGDVVLGGFGPPPNPILAAHSDDGGRTFTAPVQVSDPERQRVVAPALALGPHHSVHVVYYDLLDDAVDYQGLEGPVWDGSWALVHTVSSDGGRRFGPGSVVDDQIVPSERVLLIFTMPPPGVGVFGDSGELCVAWTDKRYGDPDVLLRCSSGRGARWDGPRRLNRDKRDNGASQYLPRLGVAPSGRLDAVFFDRRRDPRNALNDLTYTYSNDHGRHFGPERRLDRMPSDAGLGPRYAGAAAAGLVEFGSRLGLLSGSGAAVAAWTDTRSNRRGSPAQDIFTARARFAARPRPPWVRPAGAILLVGAGLLAALWWRRPPPVPGSGVEGGPTPPPGPVPAPPGPEPPGRR